MVSQVVFYVFACIAYTQKQDSFFAPLGILTFGLIILVVRVVRPLNQQRSQRNSRNPTPQYGWRYGIGSQSVHTRKNRAWYESEALQLRFPFCNDLFHQGIEEISWSPQSFPSSPSPFIS